MHVDDDDDLEPPSAGEEFKISVFEAKHRGKTMLFLVDEEALRADLIKIPWLDIHGSCVWENRLDLCGSWNALIFVAACPRLAVLVGPATCVKKYVAAGQRRAREWGYCEDRVIVWKQKLLVLFTEYLLIKIGGGIRSLKGPFIDKHVAAFMKRARYGRYGWADNQLGVRVRGGITPAHRVDHRYPNIRL
ncbi:hypothetical protein F4677DRAFT_465391 [Hypoxylon crocopeplum]|nr:hypothetical protein F4677DRAFT_465391 [Hypoxylon crocopeplum]